MKGRGARLEVSRQRICNGQKSLLQVGASGKPAVSVSAGEGLDAPSLLKSSAWNVLIRPNIGVEREAEARAWAVGSGDGIRLEVFFFGQREQWF